ncbi:MAG: ABC transporter permease [Rhodobacteraceae bacterium]|jgi:ribose transport system permease protein|nr:ABC transporter permease [Paracoccaceae bacterium]
MRVRFPSIRPDRYPAIYAATGALFLVSYLIAPGSLSWTALVSMLPFAGVLALTAVGQTLVIQQRGLDLSVPGIVSLSALIITKYPGLDDRLILEAMALAILACALAGLVSGLCVSLLSVTPLVATLAVNAFALGLVQWLSGGIPSTAADALSLWALGTVAGLPNTLLVAIGIIAVTAFALNRTVMGRRFEAAGANPVAAHAVGIRVPFYTIASYVIAAILYAVAGILLAAFLKTPGIFVGDTLLLPTVAAVVLGGTALTGGVANIVASAIAALFLTQLGQIVLSIGAPTSVQLLIQSATIIIGMSLKSMAEGIGRMRGTKGGART